jgi:hypothetical protein
VSAIFRKPVHRLTKLLRRPGGKTVAEAVCDAESGLRSIAGDCLAAVDRDLAALAEQAAMLGDPPDRETLGRIYEIALRLVGPASVAGLQKMDRAAYGLCDLVDRMMTSGHAALEPVQVHLQALALLRQQNGALPADAADSIVAGLMKVREKYALRD